MSSPWSGPKVRNWRSPVGTHTPLPTQKGNALFKDAAHYGGQGITIHID